MVKVAATLFAVAAADTCSLWEIADGSCGQSDLDCNYVKYAKAAEKALTDGTCADQGYTQKTGTQTKSYPVIGDIVITTYSKDFYASCKGTADPVITSDTCYTGSAGALGLTETVTVTIHDFASAAGHVDVVGSGIEGFSCTSKSVTKSGQDLTTEDLTDCLPSGIAVTKLKYCSDSDTITVTVKDKSIPLPVSASLKKVDCGSLSATGGCSAADQANLADPKNVGDKQDKCGKSALGLTGINHDKFTSCVQSDLSISASCSECYYAVADYGFKNCKAACLLGWCKSGCLSCTQPAQDTLATCSGFSPGSADPCLETTATGACSADEQGKLGDSATVGKAGSDCGLGAYNIVTGNFNHDKFNSCFSGKVGISSGCSECYATNGEFAAKNCKAACLLGWCKSGCLDCSTAAAPKSALDSCTGFTSGSADPCMDDIAV